MFKKLLEIFRPRWKLRIWGVIIPAILIGVMYCFWGGWTQMVIMLAGVVSILGILWLTTLNKSLIGILTFILVFGMVVTVVISSAELAAVLSGAIALAYLVCHFRPPKLLLKSDKDPPDES